MTIGYGKNLGLMADAADGDVYYADDLAAKRGLDALVQCNVVSNSVTAQPSLPADGDCYILPNGSTGNDWLGKDTKIARFSGVTGIGWEFYTPQVGWYVYVKDASNYYTFDGLTWNPVASGGSGGTTDHSQLTTLSRAKANQHPASAIQTTTLADDGITYLTCQDTTDKLYNLSSDDVSNVVALDQYLMGNEANVTPVVEELMMFNSAHNYIGTSIPVHSVSGANFPYLTQNKTADQLINSTNPTQIIVFEQQEASTESFETPSNIATLSKDVTNGVYWFTIPMYILNAKANKIGTVVLDILKNGVSVYKVTRNYTTNLNDSFVSDQQPFTGVTGDQYQLQVSQTGNSAVSVTVLTGASVTMQDQDVIPVNAIPDKNVEVTGVTAKTFGTTLDAALEGIAKVSGDTTMSVATYSALPVSGDVHVLYIVDDTNTTWRWSGTGYTQLSSGLALGHTAASACPGDEGYAGYTHSQIISGNPHNATSSMILYDPTNYPGETQYDYNIKVRDSINTMSMDRLVDTVMDFSNSSLYKTSDINKTFMKYCDLKKINVVANNIVVTPTTIDLTSVSSANTQIQFVNISGAVIGTEFTQSGAGIMCNAAGGDPHVVIDGMLDLNLVGVGTGANSISLAVDVVQNTTVMATNTTSAAVNGFTQVKVPHYTGSAVNGDVFTINVTLTTTNTSATVTVLPTSEFQTSSLGGGHEVIPYDCLDVIPALQIDNSANVFAQLDVNGKLLASQYPAGIDEVVEVDTYGSLPPFGQANFIYLTLDTNLTYRWSGTVYVPIDASLALGTTAQTAYRGDYGNTAYTHSQLTSSNPHKVTKTDVGLSNVDNTSDASKPVSTATQAAINAAIPQSFIKNFGDTTETWTGQVYVADGSNKKIYCCWSFFSGLPNGSTGIGYTNSYAQPFANMLQITHIHGLMVSTLLSTATNADVCPLPHCESSNVVGIYASTTTLSIEVKGFDASGRSAWIYQEYTCSDR